MLGNLRDAAKERDVLRRGARQVVQGRGVRAELRSEGGRAAAIEQAAAREVLLRHAQRAVLVRGLEGCRTAWPYSPRHCVLLGTVLPELVRLGPACSRLNVWMKAEQRRGGEQRGTHGLFALPRLACVRSYGDHARLRCAGAAALLSGARAVCTAAISFARMATLAIAGLSTAEACAARTSCLLCRGLFLCAKLR